MGFLFGNKKKDKIIAIFDIGSGSIGGGIVRIPREEGSIPVILKSVRTEIKSKRNHNISSLLEETISALAFNSVELKREGYHKIDEIHCVLSSPWYISETRLVKYTKDKYFSFNEKIANELIEGEIAKFSELYQEKYGDVKSKPELIEHHTLGVSLNGYNIDNPIGKMTKSAEISIFTSVSPSVFLSKVRDTLDRNFHRANIKFSSFIMNTYIGVRDRYVTPKSYILLDIAGEITDVGIVLNGVLKSSLSFPFGKKTFFKYMSTKLDIEMRDAEEIFSLYSSGKLSEEYKEKITPLFKSIEGSWGEAFRECISTLPRTLILPNTIFLTADNDIKGWFSDVLKTEEHIQKLVEGGKCSVVTLEGQEFLNMCSVKDGTCDPFLMIEAIFFMRKNENTKWLK